MWRAQTALALLRRPASGAAVSVRWVVRGVVSGCSRNTEEAAVFTGVPCGRGAAAQGPPLGCHRGKCAVRCGGLHCGTAGQQCTCWSGEQRRTEARLIRHTLHRIRDGFASSARKARLQGCTAEAGVPQQRFTTPAPHIRAGRTAAATTTTVTTAPS